MAEAWKSAAIITFHVMILISLANGPFTQKRKT